MARRETSHGRWSRLKEAKRQSGRTASGLKEDDKGTVPARGDDAGGDPAGPPPDLPDVETLDEKSDFSAFLGDGVPEDLHRAALRKLWRSDSSFANLDGLNDYDDDYSILAPLAAAVAETLKKSLFDEEPVAGEDREDGNEPSDPGLTATAEPLKANDAVNVLDDGENSGTQT